jgi:hypothetical protein
VFADDISKDQKLGEARKLFEDTESQLSKWLRQAQEDLNFAEGRQWRDEDLETLKRQQRPALTFNLIGASIREIQGANEDARRVARVVPVGGEDLQLAEIYQTLWQQVYKASEIEEAEGEVFKKGLKCGLAGAALDVNPSPENPDEYVITVEPLNALEVMFDPSARRMNLSDARYAFWHRWVSEVDYKRDYPEKADRFEHMLGISKESPQMLLSHDYDTDDSHLPYSTYRSLTDERYYDSNNKLVRLIRLEYEQPLTRYFAWDMRPDPQTGQPIGWTEVERQTYVAFDRTDFTEVREVHDREMRWLEFVGWEILFDDPNPIPIDGMSLIPFVADIDDEKGRPVGIVKHLKDPQREVNKRYSQAIHLWNVHAQPGTIAEDEAIPNQKDFDMKQKTPGATAIVAKGALVEGRVKERSMPNLPTGPQAFGQESLAMYQRVLGLALDPLIGERVGQEAAATHLLRHRKSLSAMAPLFGSWRGFQKRLLKNVLQVVLRLFPDTQIERLLGNTDKWRVQNGRVVLQGQQGQPKIFPIRALRDTRHDIQLDTAASDTTGQLLILQLLTSLGESVPVDPTVIVDELPLPKDKRERLKQYVATVQAQQAQATQQQTQVTQQQMADLVGIEGAKVQQRAVEAAEKMVTERMKATLNFATKLMDDYVQADTAEKNTFMEFLKLLLQQGAQEVQAPTEQPPGQRALRVLGQGGPV